MGVSEDRGPVTFQSSAEDLGTLGHYQVLSELGSQMSNDELFRLVAEIVRDPSDPLFDTAIHELAWSRRPKAKPLVL